VVLRAQKPLPGAYPRQPKTLADHLRKRRLDLKMTQEELAEKLRTTVCTVRNLEKNKSSPSLVFMPKIVAFLVYVPYDTSVLDFGKQVVARRHLLGLRQKDLAQFLGVDPSTIKRWENNQSCPPRVLMERVSALLTNTGLRGSAKHR
jgi:transcriptional regulator with XRE-family HTH domain